MRNPHRAAVILLLTAFTLLPGLSQAQTPPKLPWKIAFLRGGDIWTMNGDGTNQARWKSLGNIIGKPCWSPNGDTILFTRRGQYNYQLPDGGGGSHRLYDIFAGHIDSTRDEFWWWVTLNHGSRSPSWSPDGKYIIYARDMNSNQVDAELPDYQIEYRNWDGTQIVRLTRPDAKPGDCQGLEPTWSPDGKQIAFIYVRTKQATGGGGGGALNPIGLVVVPATGIVRSEEELRQAAEQLPSISGPIWSPDGKWIAYVDTKSDDGGIYLVSPDGQTKKQIFKATERIIPYQGPVTWSPDSKWIAFASVSGYIFLIDSGGSGTLHRLTSNGNDYHPAFARK